MTHQDIWGWVKTPVPSEPQNSWEKNGKKGDAGTFQRSLLVVMVFILVFNVSSLSLMFYVVGVLGLFCP